MKELNELCENFKVKDNVVAVSTAFEVNLSALENLIESTKILQDKEHKENNRFNEVYCMGFNAGLKQAIKMITAIKNCVIVPKSKDEENDN